MPSWSPFFLICCACLLMAQARLSPRQEQEIDSESQLVAACPDGQVCIACDFIVIKTPGMVYFSKDRNGCYHSSKPNAMAALAFEGAPEGQVRTWNSCKGQFKDICY